MGSTVPSLFREANREFELEEPAPPASPGLGTSRRRRPRPEAPMRANVCVAAPASRRCPEPEGAPGAQVALAKEMKRLMGEFGVDLATVTQAFLKNSGEVAAVASYLRTGRRPDGRPLWSRRDDEDLLECPEGARSPLEAKYGAENVKKRLLFRGSLCRK
ncbi:PREDICTED: telomeric repeat-binding factor 2-interacting protein 1 [Thamnophis sirtalis]|uniref:Telomeric repeat-binding factor 2-interacting protein 1 n=1 Tax=Thamnophis sirtalis TaxID=35019 RepID=A0A6I9Y547_9SAUR|nr:PREDICTED: telomeric repeat-binding factor 2-interacting protein 1 [Thamnophis sirtalis]